MNEKELEILERNIQKGDAAEKAYKLYVEDFIEESKQRVADAFEQLSVDDVAGLHKLKLTHSGILALERNILTDIESRDMASSALSAEAASVETTH